jgi:hypothetical protein
MGLILIILSPVILYFLINGALVNIDVNGKKDINKPIPWIIIISIFTPISVGLGIFGYYAFKGEYDDVNDYAENDHHLQMP